MAPQHLANAPHSRGINHTPCTHAIPSDHALIYAEFPLQLNTNTPMHIPGNKYLYKAVASIPLTLHTNPQNPNEKHIIPDGKLMTEEEHDQAISTINALHNAHNQPTPQQYLKESNNALDQLDNNTHIETTELQQDQKAQPWKCIPHTSNNRLLLDQAYTKLRKGVEQIFTICDLTQNNTIDPIIIERQRITTGHTNNNNKPQPIPPRFTCQLTIQTIKNNIACTTAIIKYSQQHQQNPDKEHTQNTHEAHWAIHKNAPNLIHLSNFLDKNFSQKK